MYAGEALQSWLDKGRSAARPVLDRLIGRGIVLVQGEVAQGLASASRMVLEAGPHGKVWIS